MIKKLLSTISAQRIEDSETRLRNNFLRHEARVGGRVFGPVGKNQRREFFCLDEHTWVWHEEWVDKNGERRIVMTQYDVRPSGILKSQNGSHYQNVGRDEAERLHQAAKLYYDLIKREVYSFV